MQARSPYDLPQTDMPTPSPSSELAQFESGAERFHVLVNSVTEYAIYMMDKDGYVTSWNVGAERLKGYTQEEIIGQHYFRFFRPADRDAGKPEMILAKAKAEGRAETEGWRRRKDGTEFWALAVVHAIRDKSGRHIGFAKVTRDMTERRAAQLALAESERRFRLLVQSVVDYAIFMLHPSGLVANWNAGAERIKGYTEAEIVGQHFSRFYTWEDRAAGLPARFLATAAREGRCEVEGWRVRKDGTRFWAAVVIDAIHDESGALIGFAKVTRDFTEQRKAQDALRESERQFRLLMNSVTDYALYMLDLNGIIVRWNTGAERIKGYSADEILGQHFSKFYPEKDRLAGLPAHSLHLAATQGRFESEGWRVRKDGTMFWANVVIDPVRDEQGKIIGFAKITRDITDRREAQQALQTAQEQLVQVQKMEALGQVTGGVAHDFNNLLMVISGYIHTIKEKLADDPKGSRAAAAIEKAASRGESLTRQLLSFARRQSLHPTALDLRETISNIRPMLASSLGGRFRIVETVAPGTWHVCVDENEFELALLNLSINARDAMSEEGIITITAENVILERGTVPGDIEGEFVALSVADTGSGIPLDVLPKVFDPFFTTKGADRGTGLGLSQVHGFAHQSGGTVTIRSEVGKGTCVTLYLPCAGTEGAAADPVNVARVPVESRRVLLVEDNPEVADATRELLEQLGCDVAVVGSAQSALFELEKTPFDLVLSDVVVPGAMNGLELARVIRATRPAMPVLLVSGYSSAAQEAASEFVVLRKPYDIQNLSEALGNAIQRWGKDGATEKVIPFREKRQPRV